ncbi:MAG: serine hydrolase [Flavisolibacter sp.]
MRTSVHYRVIHLSLALILLCNVHTTSAQGLSPQTQARLMQVLQTFQNDPLHPFVGGLSAAIKIDDLADWQGATGFASRNIDGSNNLLPGGTSFTVATLSRAYSVTKTFTAALVLELAKEGTFSLDQPVSQFLPLNAINPGLNSAVTIRQLLAHESGYSDFTDNINFQIAVAFQPTKVWSPFESMYFSHQENAPGVVRKYSSTNYIILGAIIEAVTNKPVEQLFRERFLNPLQLSSMYLAGRELIGTHGSLASPHDNISALNPIFQFTGQPTFPDAFTNIRNLPFTAIETISFTSGGIVSNARDLSEWGSALFGGRATSTQTINQMVNSISTTPDEDGDYLGYGIWRTTKISSTDVFLGHDGSATGYRSVMFYQPERKLTLVVMTNFHGTNLYNIAKALYEALPDFMCSTSNDNKVVVCKNGMSHCIARAAASNMIRKGAYLGPCEGNLQNSHATIVDETEQGGQNQVTKANVQKETIQTSVSLKAFPNPFSSETVVTVNNVKGNVQLDLVDANGQVVSKIFSGMMGKGQRNFKVSANKLPAGMYTIRMTGNNTLLSQKVLIIQ